MYTMVYDYEVMLFTLISRTYLVQTEGPPLLPILVVYPYIHFLIYIWDLLLASQDPLTAE